MIDSDGKVKEGQDPANILYSEKLESYYIGFTGNGVTSRLKSMIISSRSDLAVSMDEGLGPDKKNEKRRSLMLLFSA